MSCVAIRSRQRARSVPPFLTGIKTEITVRHARTRRLMERPSALLISAEPLAAGMAGPAIRTYELGRALAPHAEVVLACPQAPEPPPELELPLLTFHRADPRPLRAPLEHAT